MNYDATNRVLNKLLAIHARSLPMYLGYAAPWWHEGDEAARETLAHVVADQKELIERIGRMIVASEGAMAPGEFPMEFTGYNDLSMDYLVGKMIEHQQRDIASIERCVAQLAHDPMAKALSEESLGAAKGYLDSLRELRAKPNPVAAA
jgi:hypothetical protein